VDPVPDPLLLRNSSSAGNRTRDLWTTRPQRRSVMARTSIKMSVRTTQVLVCPLRALTSIHPDVPASFRYLCSLTPAACQRLTRLICVPDMSITCTTHPYTSSLSFSCTSKKAPFQGLINSCACLLLVRLVVVRGIILSHGRANGNWGSLFHFLPPSYLIRNVRVARHPLSRWYLARLLKPWRWKQYVPPKRRLTFNGLHGFISSSACLLQFGI
jgi:hypothetical protein